MTSEEQQNDMSMEDILSSIKDILENNSQEENPDDKDSSSQQTNVVATEPQETPAPVLEEEPEDDVFDLSKSMIVEDAPIEDSHVELDEAGPDFDLPSTDEPLLSPDDIKLPDFENEDSDIKTDTSADENLSLWNAEEKTSSDDTDTADISQDDDFSFNIDDILQSASDVMAEDVDAVSSDADDIHLDTEKTDVEIETKADADDILPDLPDMPEIDVTSEPVLDEEADSFAFMPDVSEIENTVEEQKQENEIQLPEPENINEPEIQEPEIQEPKNEKVEEDISVEAMPINEIPAAVDEDPQEIPEAEFSDVEEDITPEPVAIEATEENISTEDVKSEEKEDAADVSADIINNFAKMFAEQSQEHSEKTEEPKQETPMAVSEMGNGNKTIEQVVEGVIQGIVASSVSAEMTKNVDIVAYAQKEIHAQTRAWLEANLPAIVEAAVQKEIERVMAKVGK